MRSYFINAKNQIKKYVQAGFSLEYAIANTLILYCHLTKPEVEEIKIQGASK